jgi:ankyrin repeat protein
MRRLNFVLFLVLVWVSLGRCNSWADVDDRGRPIFKEGVCDQKRAEKAARLAYGWKTLTLSVLHNDLPRVKKLLNQGGNVNTTDTLNRSLLVLALKHDLKDMSRFLIERGADVNLAMTERGNHRQTQVHTTALAVALRQKDFEMAKLLLQKGATPSIAPGDERITSRTLTQWATDLKRKDIVQFLKDQGVKEGPPRQAKTPRSLANQPVLPPVDLMNLHEAAGAGEIERVRTLLDQGADLNAKNQEGLTPLALSVKEQKQYGIPGRMEVIKLFLNRGAFLKPSEKGASALFRQIIGSKDKALVQLLLKKGYSPNGEEDPQSIPLFSAVWVKDLEMVKLLVEAGANLQTRLDDGKSVLDCAYMYGTSDLVEYFEKQHKMTRSAPNTDLGESREVLFQSKGFEEGVNTGKLDLGRYRTEKEIFGSKYEGSQGSSIDREIRYYLRIQNCPDRIFLGSSRIDEQGKPTTIYIGAEELTLKWLLEGRLIRVKLKNGYTGNGAWEEDENLLIPVEGNRLGTPFFTTLKTDGKMGQGDYYRGEEEWTSGTKENEFILTRTESHDESVSRSMRYSTPARILHMGKSGGETVFVIDQGRKIQYTFRIQGKRLVCVSARHYFLKGNEVPMVNIAEHVGLTLPRLWELNPGTKGDLFGKGTLYIGETELLKSEPVPEE